MKTGEVLPFASVGVCVCVCLCVCVSLCLCVCVCACVCWLVCMFAFAEKPACSSWLVTPAQTAGVRSKLSISICVPGLLKFQKNF